MFFRKSIINSGLLNGFSDIHTHILWGVDDGMQTVDETFEALNFYELHGAKRICFTPHIMEDLPENTPGFLTRRFEEIKSAYTGSLELGLGAEYMIDSAFGKHLTNSRLLTISGNRVLIETSYLSAPAGFNSILYDIQSKGYEVILAHPERYNYMTMSDYVQLKKQNINFQLNILALLGVYGQSAKAKAHKLLNNNMYDCVGSDIHNLNFHAKKYNAKTLKRREIFLLKSLIEKFVIDDYLV
jgi:tyrosine-protein phosphatase YwqE